MAYDHLAQYYDLLYGFKNYESEVAQIEALLADRGIEPGASIVDVGCGTGRHLSLLANKFAVAGVDISPEMVELARSALPSAEILCADMRHFEFGRQFDACLCLFSAIGYMLGPAALDDAVANMARHVRPGGVVMVEAWLKPEEFIPGHVDLTVGEQPALKIARVGTSRVEGNESVFSMHFLVGRPSGVEHFVEEHRMTMFTNDEYEASFTAAGMSVTRVDGVLTNRGLWVGTA